MADNHSSKAPVLISDLPDEHLVHILKKLCYCHFNKVSQVSKRFNILLKDVDLTEKMKNNMSTKDSKCSGEGIHSGIDSHLPSVCGAEVREAS